MLRSIRFSSFCQRPLGLAVEVQRTGSCVDSGKRVFGKGKRALGGNLDVWGLIIRPFNPTSMATVSPIVIGETCGKRQHVQIAAVSRKKYTLFVYTVGGTPVSASQAAIASYCIWNARVFERSSLMSSSDMARLETSGVCIHTATDSGG
jgi:hypothetical protein